MRVRQMRVADAYVFIPARFPDQRGHFAAPYQEQVFTDTVGHPLQLAQANHSVSRRGVIRGVHYADTPPGQAKYVYCPRGALLDIVVDLRVGSPTFGTWDTVRLDAQDLHAVYLAEGLGHAFMALEDDTVAAYLCSTSYNPGVEHGIDPLDPELGLPWPKDIHAVLSDKDAAAPSLATAAAGGQLPQYLDCLSWYESLRG